MLKFFLEKVLKMNFLNFFGILDLEFFCRKSSKNELLELLGRKLGQVQKSSKSSFFELFELFRSPALIFELFEAYLRYEAKKFKKFIF